MAKEILYRIEFEGTEKHLKALDEIAMDLAKIQIKQNELNVDDKKTAAQKQRQSEVLKASARERQQEMAKVRRSLQDEIKLLNTEAGTLENLRAKARLMSRQLETGAVVGTKEFKKLSTELGQINERIRTADKSAGQFKTSIGNYGDAFQKLGGIFGATVTAGSLIALGKSAIAVYDEQIKAETGLLVALKGRKDIQDTLIKQATELQGKTLFDDSVTIEAQKQLAVFGLTQRQIEQLIPLIQDFATSQGKDLSEAASLVGKSIGSSTNALKRLGIEFDTTGTKAEKTDALIAALTEKFKGQAEAAALVGSGPLKQVNMAFGELLETLGKFITGNTVGFWTSLKNELVSLNDVLNNDSIPAWQRFLAIWSPQAKQELKFRTEIINKLNEEKNAAFNAAVERIDIINQDIETKKALIEQLKEENKQKISEIKINQELDAVRRIEAEKKAAEDRNKVYKDFLATLEALIPTYGQLIKMAGGMQFSDKFAGSKKARGVQFGLEEEFNVPDEIDTTKVVSEIGKNKVTSDLALNSASEFVSIWTDAYARQADIRQQSLDKQLKSGLISEKKYEREVAKIRTEQARKDKAASLIQAIINTALGVTRAMGDGGLIGAAIAAIIGATQIGLIASQPIPQYAKGGMIDVGGNSHASGGTKFVGSDGSRFEAERGEVITVVNKRDSARLRALSDLNSEHGRPFYTNPSGNYFATGGVFQPNRNIGGADTGRMVRQIVSEVAAIPVQVSLNEIKTKDRLSRKVEVIGSL